MYKGMPVIPKNNRHAIITSTIISTISTSMNRCRQIITRKEEEKKKEKESKNKIVWIQQGYGEGTFKYNRVRKLTQ